MTMARDNKKNNSSDRLRQISRERLKHGNIIDPESLTLETAKSLLHELEVYRLELEIQNDELKKTQESLELSRSWYVELYNNSLTGYCTISEKGFILESNFIAGTMLGLTREGFVNRLLSSFISKEYQDVYYLNIRKLFKTGEPQVFELRMVKKDGAKFWALLNATEAQYTDGSMVALVVIVDISASKESEKEKENISFQLKERIKELSCLYLISAIMELPGISLDEMLQKIAGAIPSGFKYPDIVCARIKIDGKEYETDNYRKTKWKLACDIIISDTKYGCIEVFTLKERPETDGNIFLNEEQDLLDAIAQRLGRVIERKKAEDALIVNNLRQEMANAAGGVGIWNLDLVTNELTWDDQMFALYGITRDQFSNARNTWETGIHPQDKELVKAEIGMAISGEKEFDTEFRVVWPDGTVHFTKACAQLRRDASGILIEIIGTTYDITDRKKTENEILHISYHDMLTGLYNRRFFEEEIKRLDTERQLPLSIIMGDLNNLKLTNDAFGHLEGDRLLKETAKLLKKVCRSDDILARWGGDEFVILLPKTSIASAEEIVQRIKKECSELFIQNIPIGLAIGIAAKTEHEQNIEDIILEAESNMYKNKLAGKQSSAGSVISALEQALYEKSNETMEHTQRLKELSLKLGKKLKLHPHQIDELSLLASLHDIGKVAVPETILLKEGALSENEWKIIKRHPEIGYNIAQSSPQIAHIARLILSCHENWDGSGYPAGLAKEKIPLLSRIVAIADSYDVMTSKRTYKDAMNSDDAVKELRRCAGTQFDPALIEKFIEVLAEK